MDNKKFIEDENEYEKVTLNLTKIENHEYVNIT
jgi:hypothetical protein